MKITKVIINNFKVFKNLKIDLKDFTVLVGDNGAGKSTLLEAIHLALTGFYKGKPISGNISQDLFNAECVEKYLSEFNSGGNPVLPKITIELFFDEFPLFEGDSNSLRSSATGFTFRIIYDDRYNDAYQELKNHLPLKTLPFEFYKVELETFARNIYPSAKYIPFKSAYLNSNSEKFGDTYYTKLIKSYIDDASKVELNQKFRENTESLNSSKSFSNINNKFSECKDLASRNVSLGITNSSQNAWESAITIKENDVPYENIGTGNQLMINTILSFENDFFKNKGIVLIEEPENHLSSMNLNILLKYMKDCLTQKEVQAIVSTHSSYVLNKLGMKNLLLMNGDSTLTFDTLDSDTAHYFEKVAGFDTLRYILCKEAILVEGDSDDLVVQRAYLDLNGALPIEHGVEIIDTGLSYCRFLDLSTKLKKPIVVITDNDGNIDRINEIKEKYKDYNWIKIYSGEKVFTHEELGYSKDEVPNVNTLEPEILRANSREILNRILEKTYDTDEKLAHHMITNKTECAWKIFNSKESIEHPKYIYDALKKEDKGNE